MNRGQRIVTFDLLRGYFLFVIIIDHLGRYPGLFEIFTGKGWLWTSAAEGFFFISGIMLGLIRGRKEKEIEFKIVAKKLFSRGLFLYTLTVSLTLLFSFIASFYVGNPNLKAGSIPMMPIEPFIQNVLTFQYIYGWADFLKYYTIFMFISPLAVFLLRKNLWYVLFFISISTWYFFRMDFFTCAWQILFFTGIIIGYYIPEITVFIKIIPNLIRNIIVIAIISLSIITITISSLVVHFSDYIRDTGFWNILHYFNLTTNDLFDKSSLPVPRLIIFYLWFSAFFIIFNKYHVLVTKLLGKFLLTLGRNSLFTYITHSFFVFFVYLFIPNTSDFLSNILVTTLVLFTIYSIVRNKDILCNVSTTLKNLFLPNIQRLNWHYTYMNIREVKNIIRTE